MRTQKEIKERAIKVLKDDFFGFEVTEYVKAFTKATAKSSIGTVLKKDADIKKWKQEFKTDKDIKKCAVEYMPFAWEKANNFRGISSARSMMHYKAWLWLMGRDDFEDLEEYENYGKDNLRRICEFLKIDADEWDDKVRLNEEP